MMQNIITADWAMVIITAIYVIATVLILRANNKTVRVAKEQVEEMRREFDENNRPRIEIELDLEQRVMYNLKFVNRGIKTAYHVKVFLNSDFLESIRGYNGISQLQNQIGKECIIGAGQHYDLFLFDIKQKDNTMLRPISGTVEYQADGIKYQTDFELDIRNYMTFFSHTTEEEKMQALIDRQNAEIGRLNETIFAIVNEMRALKASVNKGEGISDANDG